MERQARRGRARKTVQTEMDFGGLGARAIAAHLGSQGSSRIACVHVPLFPLQVLLRKQPTWTNGPVVVIEDDRPNAAVRFVNAAARGYRIAPGMRYGEARALCPDLRASVVTDEEVEAFEEEILQALRLFSPRVEAAGEGKGIFFADPEGLSHLFGDLRTWARAVHAYVSRRCLSASVIVGFHRFRTEANARTRRGAHVLQTPTKELELAAKARLDRLDLPQDLVDALSRLDVRTLGALLRLPCDALRIRFGEEVAELHARASEGPALPVQPTPIVDPIQHSLELDPPEDDATRLLFGLKSSLVPVMGELERRGEALAHLRLTFEFEKAPSALRASEKTIAKKAFPYSQVDAPTSEENAEEQACRMGDKPLLELAISPAHPCRDSGLILDLIRLRLSVLEFDTKITCVRLEAGGVRHEGKQIASQALTSAALPELRKTRARDLDAGEKALARIRALYGLGSIGRARLRSAHLPESSFGYEPVERVERPRRTGPSKKPSAELSIIRRVLAEPRPLSPAVLRTLSKGVRFQGSEIGKDRSVVGLHDPKGVVRCIGPYRISVGWWERQVERDYYYLETHRDDLVWVYYDRAQKSWFVHGLAD